MLVYESSIGCAALSGDRRDRSTQRSVLLDVDGSLIPGSPPDSKLGCPLRSKRDKRFLQGIERIADT